MSNKYFELRGEVLKALGTLDAIIESHEGTAAALRRLSERLERAIDESTGNDAEKKE